ncbi:MAG: arginine deiminase family protein [Pseudomonadota bacterium]
MAGHSAFTFDTALLRAPATTVSRGLTSQAGEPPDYDAVRAEHRGYRQSLQAAGVETIVLPPLEAFPDSLFVEDPALVFGGTAIVLRPGAPSREGEAAALAPSLGAHFDTVMPLPGDGHVDGGDVLVTSREVLIGLSARTDRVGADALARCLARLDLAARIVTTPPGVLHFKSDCALLDERTVLTTERLARSGVFEGYDLLTVPDDELAAANALRINDSVLVGATYTRTAARLRAAGYATVPVPVDAIARLDAGLSCLSLRWRSR